MRGRRARRVRTRRRGSCAAKQSDPSSRGRGSPKPWKAVTSASAPPALSSSACAVVGHDGGVLEVDEGGWVPNWLHFNGMYSMYVMHVYIMCECSIEAKS